MANRREFFETLGIAAAGLPVTLSSMQGTANVHAANNSAASNVAGPGDDSLQEGPLPWEEYWKLKSRLGTRKIFMESFPLRGKRQLFIDNLVIEHMDNLHKSVHQFQRASANPLIWPTAPWEPAVAWISVIRDQEAGLFKAWYHNGPGLCYATSRDGFSWEKPELGIIEREGSKANNIVLWRPGIDSPTVLKDPFETNPARVYKFFAKFTKPVFGMYVGFSADGLAWKLREQAVLVPDDRNPGLNDRPCVMQDLEKRRFIGILKTEMPNPYGRGDYGMVHRMRTISFSTDFERWTSPIVMLKPDDKDPPDLQIYGCSGFNYEGMYLGLMDMFHSRDSGPNYLTLDLQLALSRDGENWWRAGNRETLLPIGPEGSWDRYGVYPSNTPPILMRDELWLFYRGRGYARHGPPPPDYRRGYPWFAGVVPPDEPLPPGMPQMGMGLAKLRRDGFVSVDAGPRPGYLLTKPLIFDGKNLKVNVDARRGRVRGALYSAERHENRYANYSWSIGEPIEGFKFEDSVPLSGDNHEGLMRWKGGDDLERFTGRYIVIRFELIDAELYSFWLA